MEKKQSNRVVVVTGSGRGIGRSVALAFARKGEIVVIAEKDKQLGISVETEIKALGLTACFIATDVAETAQIENLIISVENRFGGIDVLINNAGLSIWHDPFTLKESEWDLILNTNLRSVFFCSREAAKRMKQRGGAIVNIASTRALMSEPNTEAYAASKGGILALTHALAASFAPWHIAVNAVLPGWIETGDYSQLKPSDHLQHFSQRVGCPDDIASACIFLTHPENDFITGTQLVIDGGMTRKMIYTE